MQNSSKVYLFAVMASMFANMNSKVIGPIKHHWPFTTYHGYGRHGKDGKCKKYKSKKLIKRRKRNKKASSSRKINRK